METLTRELLNTMECASWFMIIADGVHDLYLDNERDIILGKYANRAVKRYVGMGNRPFHSASSVKIELV